MGITIPRRVCQHQRAGHRCPPTIRHPNFIPHCQHIHIHVHGCVNPNTIASQILMPCTADYTPQLAQEAYSPSFVDMQQLILPPRLLTPPIPSWSIPEGQLAAYSLDNAYILTSFLAQSNMHPLPFPFDAHHPNPHAGAYARRPFAEMRVRPPTNGKFYKIVSNRMMLMRF